MTRKFITFGILIIVLTGILVPHVAFGQAPAPAPAATVAGTAGALLGAASSVALNLGNSSGWSLGGWIFKQFAIGISQALMGLSSLVLVLSGLIFDWVIKFTIVDMAKNIGDSTGVGGSITQAWATLRDVANMCFIFVLLYVAIREMFNISLGNLGKTVANIIIVALLINFSLFFSKVVIDASNIVSVGFYNSITNSSALKGSSTVSGQTSFTGISGGYMDMLGVQTLYSSKILDNPTLLEEPSKMLAVGIMSSIFMLIVAVILLIAGIMFAARFIILIFLMILSPLALIAYIIPGQNKHFNDWKDALIDQSFFAPLYFALTWVVFKLGTSLLPVLKTSFSASGVTQTSDMVDMFSKPSGTAAILMNYVLIIGFSIAALIFAKSMASKTAGFKAISGGIGAATLGGVALAGRNTVGRASSLISETQREKWSKSSAGRAGLWLANKGGKASYDARGIADTKYGKKVGASDVMGIAGKAGGVGGFAKAVKDKEEAKAKYAKEVYGQTGAEKEKEGELKNKHEGYVDKNGVVHKGSKKEYEEAVEKEKKETTDAENDAKQEREEAKEELKSKEKALQKAKDGGLDTVEARKGVEEAEAKLNTATAAHKEAFAKKIMVLEERKYTAATKILGELAKADEQALNKVKNIGGERQKAYAENVRGKSPVLTSTGAVVGGAIGSVIPIPVVGTIIGAAIGAGVGSWAGGKLPEKFNWAGNKAAARKIRADAGGKSTDKKIADLLREETKNTPAAASGGEGTPTPPPAPAAEHHAETAPPTPTPSP